MRSYLERLPIEAGSSLNTLDRRLTDAIPFQWHHHPQFELTMTLNSRGRRFIGDHIGEYDDGDLVLVGPNLPHTWASREKVDLARPHVALVVWFLPELTRRLTEGVAEFRAVEAMLAAGGAGLRFSRASASEIRNDFEALFRQPPADRLLALLKILDILARDEESSVLASAPARQRQGHSDRIDRVLTHVHANYARELTLQELAGIAALSLSGLHRLFRRQVGATISEYVTKLRIGDACSRLSETHQPIGHIADAAGYSSLANFNRQFKALKAMTPKEYRGRFQDARRDRKTAA